MTVERTPSASPEDWMRSSDFVERYEAKLIRRGPDECWDWKSVSNRVFVRDNTAIDLRRVAWFFAHGNLPPRSTRLRATCGSERCANPAHIYAMTEEERFWSSVNKNGPVVRAELGPCWEWTGGLVKGYGAFYIGASGSTRSHRHSWILANGQIPEGLIVCHKCDNPKCVRVEHLFLGTDADNHADRVAKGRGARTGPKRARPPSDASLEDRARALCAERGWNPTTVNIQSIVRAFEEVKGTG